MFLNRVGTVGGAAKLHVSLTAVWSMVATLAALPNQRMRFA